MNKKGKKSRYMKGKTIEPLNIEDSPSISEFVDKVYCNSGFNARSLGEACKIYERMINENATICLTLAGAMTPIGMSGPIISLMKRGFVDFVISTGANLYHDLHRAFNLPMIQGNAFVDDEKLNCLGISRIYDIFIEDKDTLMETDKIVLETAENISSNTPISTSKFHYELGKRVLKTAKNSNKSLLAQAVEFEVPVYTSSPGDSSIGMNLVGLDVFRGKKILIDIIQDVLETTAIVHDAEKNGAVEICGGSPKNFYMQTQPTLWQILGIKRGGHDFFIQLTTDSPHYGGLSGATPQEAKSWGKVKPGSNNHAVVYSDASITFPLLAKYVLERCEPREQKRLYSKLEKMTENLKKEATRRE